MKNTPLRSLWPLVGAGNSYLFAREGVERPQSRYARIALGQRQRVPGSTGTLKPRPPKRERGAHHDFCARVFATLRKAWAAAERAA